MSRIPEELVCVGRVVKAKGISGEVEVEPFGEAALELAGGPAAFLEKAGGEGPRPCRVAGIRRLGGRLGVRLEGVDTPEAARRLAGDSIMVEASRLPELPEGQYYHYQILGLAVVDGEGNALGTIEDVLETGGNDVYVARQGAREVLIPATDQVVAEIDLAARRMRINLLPGLIDE